MPLDPVEAPPDGRQSCPWHASFWDMWWRYRYRRRRGGREDQPPERP